MRGLTVLEREILRLGAECRGGVEPVTEGDEIDDGVAAALIAAGRAAFVTHSDERYFQDCLHPTELGRLALRLWPACRVG